LSDKSLSQNYEEFYEKAHVISQQTDEAEVRYLASLAARALVRPLRILDIGCAEGRLSLMLAARGHDVTAADISEGFLRRVADAAEERHLKVTTKRLNIESDITGIFESVFDVIYFIDIVEHLKSPVAGLENVRRLLAQDGQLIIQTPNVICVPNIYRCLISRNRRLDFYDCKNLLDLHFVSFDLTTLEKTLNFVGFRISEVLPTRLALPIIWRFRSLDPLLRRASRYFPHLSNNLLVRCIKSEPIDVDRQIAFWEKNLP
jgi:2-polyprenyl-3-methyl-5-hydroxy-6-metoxy-1,4-benzoquinol methylase